MFLVSAIDNLRSGVLLGLYAAKSADDREGGTGRQYPECVLIEGSCESSIEA